MRLDENEPQNLFSYGTLQSEDVQLATFDRKLDGKSDALVGYRVTMVPIEDKATVAKLGATHHRSVEFTGNALDSVAGMVFQVTRKELDQADDYEATANYQRIPVQLQSGMNAWVYLYMDTSS